MGEKGEECGAKAELTVPHGDVEQVPEDLVKTYGSYTCHKAHSKILSTEGSTELQTTPHDASADAAFSMQVRGRTSYVVQRLD